MSDMVVRKITTRLWKGKDNSL